MSLLIAGIFVWQMISFRHDKDRINRLKQGEVKAIVVKDRSGRGPEVRFTDAEGVSRVISSLQAGTFYMPSHDAPNGLELEITLEPQGMTLTTYRHPRVPDAVVVSVAQDHILCTPFSTWQPLEKLLSEQDGRGDGDKPSN